MSAAQGQMKLGLMLSASGSHVASWRYPGAQDEGGVDFQRFAHLATKAEAAKLDFLFIADNMAHQPMAPQVLSHTASYISQFEPVTLLAALSVLTSRIGLAATASTTYNAPFHVARKFASLDHLSGGRAAWNLVTSSNDAEAYNFGADPPLKHAGRYERAEEFFDVVRGLWDSFEDGALVRDKAAGIYFDPEKLHRLDHAGPNLSVRGPLNMVRPPQGHPIICQAGASEAGIELAARTADVIFASHSTTAGAVEYSAKVKGRAAAHGRSPDAIKIMPGFFPVVGRTEEEAREKFERLQSLIHPDLAVALLSRAIGGGLDLSQFPLDGPVPELPVTDAGHGRQKNLVDSARRENLTLRQLSLRFAGGSGNRQAIGTAAQIADQMEEVFLAGGADGFILASPYLPGGFDDFADLVVPELQRRGLFRTEYEGPMLRDQLGLPRPAWSAPNKAQPA